MVQVSEPTTIILFSLALAGIGFSKKENNLINNLISG
ncbi:PEP-CTERM sorting domain-containing protein [Psychromonas hadalis]